MRKYATLLLSVAAICLISVAAAGSAEAEPGVVPVRIRMVLLQVQPLMKKKAYAAAVDKLRYFLAPKKNTGSPGQGRARVYDHYLLYFTLGNCEFLMERYPEAIAGYEASIRQNPSYAPAWFNLARVYYTMERFEKAGACFVNGYEQSGQSQAQYLYYAASCYNLAQNYSKSLTTFERLLKDHPADVKPAWKGVLVKTLLARNEPRRALPYIEELAVNSRDDTRGQWQALLLSQYSELSMNDRARRYATELTMEYPLESRWWKALANLEISVGDYKAALVAMTVYGLLVPLSPDEKKVVADLYLQEDIPLKAATLYASILADEHDPAIAEKIARCYLKLGQPDRAIEWIDQALLHHSSEALFTMKGEVLYELKRYRDAFAAFEAAVKLKGNTAGRSWLMMGYCALNGGDFSTAENALMTARNYAGEKEDAVTALTYLENNRAIQK